ncbi:hypothetical protein [Streptomyces xiaopingdaonensis]|uniref:hypothetical protein n=1 Tax=Streptomyces xiaopingdaonensis TaxID=1565415 RepID=UPI0012FECDDF|nr:hypothetical protein [Streptomyces xiaopingdaonensis]
MVDILACGRVAAGRARVPELSEPLAAGAELGGRLPAAPSPYGRTELTRRHGDQCRSAFLVPVIRGGAAAPVVVDVGSGLGSLSRITSRGTSPYAYRGIAYPPEGAEITVRSAGRARGRWLLRRGPSPGGQAPGGGRISPEPAPP